MSKEPNPFAGAENARHPAGELLVEALRTSWERFVEQDALVRQLERKLHTDVGGRWDGVGDGSGVGGCPTGGGYVTGGVQAEHERIEAVHQARVALRRIRSNMRVASPLLEKTWSAAVVEDLSWYAARLGAVRDWDVLDARLRHAGSDLRSLASPAELASFEAGLACILQYLDDERRAASDVLSAARTAPRLVRLKELMSEHLDEAVLAEIASGRAGDVMPRLISKQWRGLASLVGATIDEPEDRALHAIRVRVKRVRYASEIMGPAPGGNLRRFCRSAARLQDVLGEWHDSSVSRDWLRTTSSKLPPVATFVAGELSVAEAESALSSRARWPEAWSALKGLGKKLFR